MKTNDWKQRIGMVYSTNPEYQFETGQETEIETLSPKNQILKIITDKKNRKGKIVTLVSGFIGKEEDLIKLSKELKTYCGTGGSVKNNEILIQGDLKEKIIHYLRSRGYINIR